MQGSGLVSLRMDVLGDWNAALIGCAIGGLAILQQLQAGFNMDVGRIKVGSALVCVKRISSLVVARFVLLHR